MSRTLLLLNEELATTAARLSCFLGWGGLGYAVAVDVVAGDEDWYVEQAGLAGRERALAGTLYDSLHDKILSLPGGDFIESLLAQIPPRPAEMDRIVAETVAA